MEQARNVRASNADTKFCNRFVKSHEIMFLYLKNESDSEISGLSSDDEDDELSCCHDDSTSCDSCLSKQKIAKYRLPN